MRRREVLAALAALPLLTARPPRRASASYDDVVLGDSPVAFWDLDPVATQADLTGNGHTGTWHGNPNVTQALPDGSTATVLAGTTKGAQYLTVPSAATLSIPATGNLTWEVWLSPSTLNQPSAGSNGYVHFLAKGSSGTNEYKGRLYSQNTSRPSRLSGYVFNPAGGLGSGAYWQPASGVLSAKQWLHVVVEYTTASSPSWCSGPQPGSVGIWVNGVPWDATAHGQTGCMSQYGITPVAGDGPLVVGSDLSSFFAGAVGKAAVYGYLLTGAQIAAHYTAMTGLPVTGSCGASSCTLH